MKKTFMIALAGMMMFAFTQCGGGKESQEFKDQKAVLEKIEKSLNEAKTCDELQSAVFAMLGSAMELDKEYPEDQKMTQDEEKKLKEISDRIDKIMEEKSDLCKDSDGLFGGDSDWDSDSWDTGDLEDATGDVSDEFDKAMNDVSNELDKAMDKVSDEYGKAMDKVSDEYGKAMKQASDEMDKAMKQANDEMNKAMNDALNGLDF